MSYNKTLSELRTAVRRQADFENDDAFVSNTELNDYINTSIGWVYSLMINSNHDYFESEHTLTASGGQVQKYFLPSDFYAPKGVDYKLSDGQWTELYNYTVEQRNWFDNTSDADPVGYRIAGTWLELSPPPKSGTEIRLIYWPTPTVLSDDSDTFDFGNTWNELVEVDVAIKLRQKEESSTSQLERRKEALLDRIRTDVEHRRFSQAWPVIDTRNRPTGRFIDPADFDYNPPS